MASSLHAGVCFPAKHRPAVFSLLFSSFFNHHNCFPSNNKISLRVYPQIPSHVDSHPSEFRDISISWLVAPIDRYHGPLTLELGRLCHTRLDISQRAAPKLTSSIERLNLILLFPISSSYSQYRAEAISQETAMLQTICEGVSSSNDQIHIPLLQNHQ